MKLKKSNSKFEKKKYRVRIIIQVVIKYGKWFNICNMSIYDIKYNWIDKKNCCIFNVLYWKWLTIVLIYQCEYEGVKSISFGK